jgi:hypothetical protein
MDSPSASRNLFQRLMLQWDTLHPYNAAQILKVSGEADLNLYNTAWCTILDKLGLLQPGQRAGIVRSVPSSQSLPDFISEELNRRFDDPQEPSFRAFVLQEGEHHYAGIVYHHWAADSVSIRMLLREWFLQTRNPERSRPIPFHQTKGGYGSVFGPSAANWNVGGALLSSLRWAARNRHVARVEHHGYSDFNCRFALHDLGAGLVTPLLAYARRHGATLNDLFLAVTAEICDRFVPLHKNARRPNLALGTIVDLRPYSERDLSDTFGLFLGFTSTHCRPTELKSFPRLLQSIASQSQRDKQSRVPLFSPLRMLAALAVGKIYRPKKLIEFYRKRLPLAGGISNVNLNRAWPAEFHPIPLLDYIRASPTGPMMPLVFTPTTLGNRLHVGLTYRPSLIAPSIADQMAAYFTQRLTALANG